MVPRGYWTLKQDFTQSRLVKRVRSADEAGAIVEAIENHLKIDSSGRDVKVEYLRREDVDEKLIEWMIDLIEKSGIYDYPSWYWSRTDQRRRFKREDQETRFLIVRSIDSENILAFAQICFSTEFYRKMENSIRRRPLLIVSEIQVIENQFRRGLGTLLMCLGEVIAKTVEIEYIEVAIFNNNEVAKQFSKKLGYDINHGKTDEDCYYKYYTKKIA